MIRVVRLCFKSEHISDFQQLFAERREQIRHFDGCHWLELWQDREDPRIFYTYSLWEDAGNLEKYRISDLFQDTWGSVKPWFAEPARAFSADRLHQLQ